MTTAVEHGRRRRGAWFTTSYGLRHCEGYRVVGPHGLAGYVEEVRLDADGEARAIVVGGRGRRLVEAGRIRSVDVDAELVRLASASSAADTRGAWREVA